MTASDDFRPERPGPVDDRPAGSASGAAPSRSDFPVRRGATAARGPVSRDEGLVGGRARFRSDRHRTWNARRDLLPGGRPVQVAGDGPDDEPPPLPDDLRVDRLEVVRDDARTAPPARTGWPAAPLPPTVAVPGGDRYPAPPATRPMPPAVGRADGSITRADLADLLPRQAAPEPGPQAPAPTRSTGRRAAARPAVPPPPAAVARPASAAGSAPLDDLMPHPERVPYGADLVTSADELFPPSTRQAPPDLLRRKPAGTSTGLQPRIFAPGTGTDESALPVLVGDPVAVREQPFPPADGVRRFDLTAGAAGTAAPVRPDPRLPVRPAPPADLDVARVWGTAPQPAGAVGPSTGPLAAVTMPAPAAPPRPSAPPLPTAQPARMPAGVAPSSTADVSDLATLFGPRPGDDTAAHPGHGTVRVGHARRPAAEQPVRRGWVVPTITAALGLVAGIVFATSSEPAAAPTPATTVTRTVTVAPTP